MTTVMLDRWDRELLEGRSLRDVECEQWCAIDGGRGWSGIVARRGREILDAATVGLVPGRNLKPHEVPDVTDYGAWLPYWQRVVDQADRMCDRFDPSRPIRVVTEAVERPKAHRHTGRARVPDRDWMPVYGLIGALAGRFTRVYVVRPQTLGERHLAVGADAAEFYAPELIGKRPAHLAPTDHPRRARRNEQSASDLAGVAEIQLHAKSEREIGELLAGLALAHAA